MPRLEGMTILEFSDSVLIERTPAEVYAMVSDVTRMGEWLSLIHI